MVSGDAPRSHLLTQVRIVALVAACLLIPWEGFLAFGFTFAFREHEPIMGWLFVWFAFLLDIPALLIGVVMARIGAWAVLVNGLVSLCIAISFEVHGIVTAPSVSITPQRWLSFIGVALVFWGPKFLYFGILMLLSRPRVPLDKNDGFVKV